MTPGGVITNRRSGPTRDARADDETTAGISYLYRKIGYLIKSIFAIINRLFYFMVR